MTTANQDGSPILEPQGDLRFPLYDPAFEHDACGVGFIVARSGESSYRMVRLAADCLVRLDHRGARAADGTGDGAGLLMEIPYAIFERELLQRGIDPPDRHRLGVLTVFLPKDTGGRELVEEGLAGERIEVLAWRPVPVDAEVLGQRARDSMPLIFQVLVEAPPDVDDAEAFERSLFLARRGIERSARRSGVKGFSIPSASGRTVVYKGLFSASRIEDFYWDLRDPSFSTSFAIFHQRYSTNTSPSWHIAQPFRTLAHNGEINTIRSNRAWMRSRQLKLNSPVWGERIKDIAPILSPRSSDSGSLDEAFELLMRSGRSVAHAKEMLIPEAWENMTDMSTSLKSFYEYHAFLTEPWDGPVAIAATDGRTLVAGVDRNGLRPLRWTVSPAVVVVASEAGVCPEEETRALATGQLAPGEILAFDLETRQLRFSDEVKQGLATARPYDDWVTTETLYVRHPFDPLQDERFDPTRFSRVFGYTAEERRLVLQEMAHGRTPLGSMGNDTPLAALSEVPRRVSHYLHQAFAQVTNPPMDPIREHGVMSLRTYLGRRGSLLQETPQQAHLIELGSPVMSDAEVERVVASNDEGFISIWIATVFEAVHGADGLRVALDEICNRAELAVRAGAGVVVLSDREVDQELAPVPMLLAVGAVHHRLIDAGLRLDASIIAVSAEPRDAHDLATLVAFGASAVNPYLAIELVRSLAASGEIGVSPVAAQENYRHALQTGLLKIMSKMGICTISSYRGSELFELIGLDEELSRLSFRYAPRRVGGVGMERIATDVLTWHAKHEEGSEDPGGFYKHRRGGITHITSPAVVLALQKAVRSGEPAQWDAYRTAINSRPPGLIRDLLRVARRRSIGLEEVAPVDHIMRRFTTAAMSIGALSKEAHEALAEAMSMIGGMSNSGEGGEDPARYGTPRNSEIKQIASGRFGVTPAYLASAEEFQIKMAQGSKPGEGGQLPGYKVSPEIARLRHTEPGITLISPPPHHDIYSIEDLAQLIYDLKSFKPSARVSVKLVSEPGVGTVAVGVAKARADVITISGADGGTGASPLVSVKHAGSPWEIGLAEAHQVLVAKGLRSRITLETDGGLRTGWDVVVAALLGAERFAFGTLPLLALGCKMVRQCHENTCPVGITTQREDLRAKFTGAPDQVVQLFTLLAEEVREHLAALGARTLDEIIGHAELLEAVDPTHPVAKDLERLFVAAEDWVRHPGYRPAPRPPLSRRLIADTADAVATRGSVEVAYPITNSDRAIGTTLSGEITRRHGSSGLREGTIRVRLAGTAGQSLAAFLAPGVSIHLDGPANDYVAKGMGGGEVVVVPRLGGAAAGDQTNLPHGAGNAVLYRATGGRLFIAGAAGQRFAVRNSGARAVVEGCSDHGCEYMTNGVVVVLGRIGRNFGAGMTGGKAFVWDPDGAFPFGLADTAPPYRSPGEAERIELREMIEQHAELTGSSTAGALLADWDRAADQFWLLSPGGPGEEANGWAAAEPIINLELGQPRHGQPAQEIAAPKLEPRR